MDICLKQQQNINNSQFRGANIKKREEKRKRKKKNIFLLSPFTKHALLHNGLHKKTVCKFARI
jgi:hypothetical protein